jgi:hypothetical protein
MPEFVLYIGCWVLVITPIIAWVHLVQHASPETTHWQELSFKVRKFFGLSKKEHTRLELLRSIHQFKRLYDEELTAILELDRRGKIIIPEQISILSQDHNKDLETIDILMRKIDSRNITLQDTLKLSEVQHKLVQVIGQSRVARGGFKK